MNGTSGKSSPDSLDAMPEDLFKQEGSSSVESSSNDVENSGIEQKAISGLDVALSEDYDDPDKQNSNSECFDTASESNGVQSELRGAQHPDGLLDTLPDGGFDDIVAMEAAGDSQFEQTMAMLRDLSGSEVSPTIVPCVDDDAAAETEHAANTETELNSNFSHASSNDCDKNGIAENDHSSEATCANDAKVDAPHRHINPLADRKHKGSSGFINRCIENLLQRGRDTAAHSASPQQTENQSGDCAVSGTGSSVKMSTTSRSHRKSRKPTKLTHMRLSEDVVIVLAKTPLPYRCNSCTYTCNTSSDLNSHSSVCRVDAGASNKFTCTYCKACCHSLEDFRSHLSHHVGDHTFHCFFCRYCGHRSDSIDNMDDHVTVHHPTQISRYEVSIEKVAYLQDMLECPVCGGGFFWKSTFVQHCRSEHHLEDLASYLEATFPESPTPKNCKVSRQLFESFADILQTDTVAEDSVSGAMDELNSEASQFAAAAVKRFKCDQCSFSADNWESWDRHVQEHHELPGGDNFLQDEDWPGTAPLVIDEDVPASGLPESQSQKLFQPCALGPSRTAKEADNSLEGSTVSSVRKEGNSNMFPPGMEPELISVNPASGDLPQLTKIGSGRKGVKLRCRLCPFECYRTPNFRRHLAIHVHQAEYPESYRCAYCKFQHRRLNCIRFHLGKYHGQLPAKLSRVLRGKVVEVINADDVSLHGSKFGRTVPLSSNNFAPMTSTSYSSTNLPIAAEDYSMNKRDDAGTTPNSCHEIPLDDQSQSGSSSSREKRLSKPPKRLSDSSDFQPPAAIFSHWKMRRTLSGGLDGGNVPPYARLTGQLRNPAGRPFDDNIAEDYILSDLPPGMIYPEPIKCPRCSFTNRVRINLVRHMKQHHTEDQQQRNATTSTSSASTFPTSEPSWMDPVPSWARSEGSSHTSVGTQSVVKNAPMKTLRNIVAGSSFASKSFRYVPKPPPKLPNQLGALSGADVKFTHGYLSSGRLEWNSEGYSQPRDSAVEAKPGSMDGNQPGSHSLSSSRVGSGLPTREASVKRLFKCAYCSVSSRWNRRDISLHVLHVHVRRRAFRCRRCGYGTSKSASAVTVHCARTHPGRPAIIEDNLTVLNAILPLHTRPGVVHVAFRRPNGIPIMNLDELEEYFGLSKITNEPAEEQNQKDASPTQTFDSFQPDDSLLQYSSSTPLDLSGQIQKDTGMSQSVFPTPYRDVLSQTHHASSSGSQRRLSDGSDKVLPTELAPVIPSSVERNRPESAGSKSIRPVAAPRRNSSSTSSAKDVTQLPPGTAFYRCKLCGYQDSRHDKTKYHVVREHLHLGPYGCAYCPRYMWGRRHVARHISAVHPNMPVQIRRAFDEFETYLRENIRKIGGQPSRFPTSNSSRKPTQSPGSTSITTPVHPDPSMVETLVQPVAPTPEPVKRKAIFQCGHCEYRDALAARVQGHCLAKHPSKPVRYRRCDEEDTSELTATGALADVKIESVESLAFGQEYLSTPDTAKSVPLGHFPDTRIRGDLSGRSQQTDTGGNLLESRSNPMDSGVMEFPPFMCRYCPESAWTEELIRSHLASAHGDRPPQFGVVQDCSGPSVGNNRDVLVDEDDDDDDDDDSAKTAGHETDGTKTSASGPVMYRCRMCHYRSDKVTVVRHHVMAHLLYHPYRCPYCDTARSVKSSPINKHIRLRHPGKEPNFLCHRDEEMERQVRNNYYRSERNDTDDSLPPPPPISRRNIRMAAAAAVPMTTSSSSLSTWTESTPPALSYDQSVGEKSSRKPAKRVLYRCKFCRLKTYVRTDMRHHLMREISYKPYRCGHCYAAAGGKGTGYSEPSRSAMGKHFRLRHAGMTIDVHDLSDPERDAEVVRLLDECGFDEEQDELNRSDPVSGGCIKRSSARHLSTSKQPELSTDGETATPPPPVLTPAPTARSSKPSLEVSQQQPQPVKKGKIKSMKLRRCPHCTYSSPSTKALAQHVAVRHRPHRLQCGYCQHMSHYPSWLRKHSRKSHPDLPFKFITMGGQSGNSPADEDDAGNFPADGEDVPQDDGASSPELEEIPDEDDQLTMDQTTSELILPASAVTVQSSSIPDKNLNTASLQDEVAGPSSVVETAVETRGMMKCGSCEFQTMSRAQFKMHSMKHRARKWQCGHCGLHFTLLLHLKQHSFMKHRGKSVKWLDTTTHKLSGDDTTQSSSSALTTATLQPSTSQPRESPVFETQGTVPRKPTARKSTSRSGIRVAMFRCGDFFSIRRCTAVDESSPSTSGSVDLSVDSGISQSESLDQITRSPLLCCHMCCFVSRSLPSFASHLHSSHHQTTSVRIEILTVDDPTTARRCGFCSFRTLSDPDFSDHVSTIHQMSPPLLCSVCLEFASFELSKIHRHFSASHPGYDPDFEALSAPYSMCADPQSCVSRDYIARDALCTVDPVVQVMDIADMTQVQFSNLLDEESVWFDY